MSQSSTPQHVLDIVTNYYRQYLQLLTPDEQVTFIKWLVEMRRGYRWPMLASEPVLDQLWKTVRETENELALDFVLGGTSNMLLHVTDIDQLVDRYVRSLSWVYNSAIVDTAITERCGDSAWFKNVLVDAPWVLFLYVATMVDHTQ